VGSDVSARLIDAWTDEVQATVVYELIARRESDPRRAAVLRQMAETEEAHRARLEARMRCWGSRSPTRGGRLHACPQCDRR
jgi:rubrerythrin